MSGFVGVVCGLKSEGTAVSASVGDDKIRIGVSGANAARAEEIARSFCKEGADAIVSVGVSGGLDPALEPGALILAESVAEWGGKRWDCDKNLLIALGGATGGLDGGRRIKIGPVFGSDKIVEDAAAKATLYREHGCIAVDMESHGAARAAAHAGAPFIAIRAIADPADRALPPAALNAVAPDGSTLVFKTLGAALRDPKQFPELIKLGADSAAALKTLRRDLGLLFGGLFLSLDL